MPMCKWQIEPRHLAGRGEPTLADHCPKDFTELSNEICSNIIKQLADLCTHAQDLFRELQLQAADVWTRSGLLTCKVTKLKDRAKQFNHAAEQNSLDDIFQCKPFKSGLNRYQAIGMGRPEAITIVYSQIEPIPDIQRLNQFKDPSGKDCTKLYSDPNFFFESWCGQIKQEVEKKPSRKRAPEKKKAEITRKPKDLNLCKIQDRMKDEIFSGTLKIPSSSKNVDSSSQQRQKEITEARSSQPAPKELTACEKDLADHVRFTSLPEPNTANEFDLNNNDSILPPPPAEILFQGSTQQNSNRATLYTIEDFDPDLLFLPPLPPSIPDAQPSEIVPLQSPPPLPPPFGDLPPPPLLQSNNTVLPQPPILPPPPPLLQDNSSDNGTTQTFASMISSNAFRLKSVDAHEAGKRCTRRQSSSKTETRGDLLTAIRNGIKLRKVDEVKQEAKNQEGSSNMFDVQMIMEMRRRALEDDDDDDYETEPDSYWDEC